MLREKLVGSEKLEGKEKLQRILELTYKGLNESKEEVKTDSDFLVKEGVDGKNYAIVKEKAYYFIKVSDNKENLLKEDFNYMGGVVYNTKYKYNSFADAVKGLNTFLYNLKESLNVKKEYTILENDRFVLRQPEPTPQSSPTPQPPVQSEPQPQMQTEPQMDNLTDEPTDMGGDFGDDEDSLTRQVQRLTGKLGQKIRDSYNSKEGFDDKMVKYVMNSIISAIRFENVNPQVKETLIGRINQTPEQNQDVPQEQQPPVQGEPQMTENLNIIESDDITTRIKNAALDAEDVFWKKITEHFPEIKTGDFPPLESFEMRKNLYEYVKLWYFLNKNDEITENLNLLESMNHITESKGLPKITIGGKTFLFENYMNQKRKLNEYFPYTPNHPDLTKDSVMDDLGESEPIWFQLLEVKYKVNGIKHEKDGKYFLFDGFTIIEKNKNLSHPYELLILNKKYVSRDINKIINLLNDLMEEKTIHIEETK